MKNAGPRENAYLPVRAGTAVLLVLLVVLSPGCGRMRAPRTGPDRFMGVEDIRPGMKGYGRTVFRGDTVEEFDVTIIGVMRNWSPRSDLILAEVHHPVVDEAGIIAGMSGSPIYVDGRLIGALAYGWAFQKKALAGITPIREMLAVSNAGPAGRAALREPGGEPVSGTMRMAPVTVPLVVSGVSSRVRAWMSRELGKHFPAHLGVAAGGMLGKAAMRIGPLQEGSAVAAKLIEGDFDIAAVGTVSCIDADTVYAFGHPFAMDGDISIPMAKAWIHTVVSSMYRSFKLSSTGGTVGVFSYDYARGIVGKLGGRPRLVPLGVSIENTETGKRDSYSFGVAHDRKWTPFLVMLAAYYAVDEARVTGTDVSVWVDSTIEAGGVEPLRRRDFFMSEASGAGETSFPLASVLDVLMDNEFKPLSIDRVTLDLKVASGKKAKRIERYVVDKKKVRPGDTLDIVFTVRANSKAPAMERMKVVVPADIPEGPVRLDVYNGLFSSRHETMRAPGLDVPGTIGQLVRRLSQPYGANDMVLDFNILRQGVVVEGKEFEDMPSSVVSAYRGLADPRCNATRYTLWRRDVERRTDVLMADISIMLDVSRYH